jgi:uncharacterized protein YccT (UPF0319 family)
MRKHFTFLLAVAGLLLAGAAVGKTVSAVPAGEEGRTDLATLILPETLDAQMFDGLDVPGLTGLVRKGEIAVQMLPGQHEIALKFSQLFEIPPGDHEIVRSKTMVLTFVAEAGRTYRATHEEFRKLDRAREAVKNFVVRIEDEQGNNRIVAATQATTNWRGQTTVTTRRDLVDAAAAAAAALAPVTMPAAVAVSPAVPATVAAPSGAASAAPAPAGGGVDALQLLRFTWQGASAEQRAAFLEWVKANP